MIEGLFTQTNYQAARKLLDATVLRHRAIATNLANLETPNYKRLDIQPDFAEQLRSSLEAKDHGRLRSLKPELQIDRDAISNRRDGNTVQLESEMMELNKNALNHNLGTRIASGALLKLRLAITGRA